MKRILSLVLACVLLVGCAFTMVSCSKKLSGTYEAGLSSYTFDGSNVTYEWKLEVFGAEVSYDATGTYEIGKDDDGKETITFNFTEGDTEKVDDNGKALSFVEGNEGDEKYIKIGGVKFVKKAE